MTQLELLVDASKQYEEYLRITMSASPGENFVSTQLEPTWSRPIGLVVTSGVRDGVVGRITRRTD